MRAKEVLLDEVLRVIDSQMERAGVEVKQKPKLPDSPWEFTQQCVYTFDEMASATGDGRESKKFPDYSYLRFLLDEVDKNHYVWVVKSGQILVSWALQAYFLWCVLKKRGYRLAYYCLSQSKAEGHIRSRFLRLYQNIPNTWDVPYARLLGGNFVVYHDGPDGLPTSFIIAMAAEQGSHEDAAAKMRSETWTRVLLDESAFYPNLEELHNSLTPRSGGIVHVSTPNGHNFFEKIGLGDITKPQERALGLELIDGVERPMNGVMAWRRNGFRCLRITYHAHPLRDPATEAGRQWFEHHYSVTTPRLWAREQECSFEVAANAPVYEAQNLIIEPTTFNPEYPLLRGWDFGHRFPFVVFGQLLPVPADGGEVKYLLFIHHEFTRQGTTTDDLARLVREETNRLFPFASCLDACDYYGGNQIRSTSPRSDVQILNSNGIYPVCKPYAIKLGVEIIQQLLNEKRLVISPSCEYLITALRTGYVRGPDGELPTEKEKEKQHPFCDAADALRYLVHMAFAVGASVPSDEAVRRIARPVSVTGVKPAPSADAFPFYCPSRNVRRVVPVSPGGRPLFLPSYYHRVRARRHL